MNRSLTTKLVLAFIVVALISTSLVLLFIRLTSADRLNAFLMNQLRSDVSGELAEYYQQYGSWDDIARYWELDRPEPGGNKMHGMHMGGGNNPLFERRQRLVLVDQQGMVVISANPDYPLGSRVSTAAIDSGVPILADGGRVGTLLITGWQSSFTAEETQFLEQTNQALLIAALAALLVAILTGILLARTMIHPLQALTRATQRIAAGDLEQQVAVQSQDEIGQLAQSFNRMSQEVARVNRLRRQMTADIAHDLRTPLTIIAGYVESMQDGVLQPTPERLALIQAEVDRLQKMVEDLRLLSQADAGELPVNVELLSPQSLLEKVVSVHQHQAEQHSLAIKLELADNLPSIMVDETRMLQVFDNLIVNAMRYTPPGGEISLRAEKSGGTVLLSVTDSGMGIAAEDLSRIFERFYRSEKSRTGENGESGLGLAIVKTLVEAQSGTVWAESSPGQGARFFLRFPIAG